MTASQPVLDSPTWWVAEHTRRYVASGGADGHLRHGPDGSFEQGVPTLLLTTTGRRSGKPRRTALIYGRDGAGYVVVASRGGAPTHPLWYLNLTEEPAVSLQVGAETYTARARTATGDEKARLWRLMLEIWPPYAEYQTRTDRDIPVVVLERA
jgi:deazaflavin-dependent oxidoreductase (nitroreductase family)